MPEFLGFMGKSNEPGNNKHIKFSVKSFINHILLLNFRLKYYI